MAVKLEQILRVGTAAARVALVPVPPANTIVFFFEEDNKGLYLWDADVADWRAVAGELYTHPDISPPLEAEFANAAVNAIVLTDYAGEGLLISGAGGGSVCRVQTKNAPAASDFTIVARVVPSLFEASTCAGIAVRDVGTGETITFGPAVLTAASQPVIHARDWTDANTIGAAIGTDAYYGGGPVWLKLVYDDSSNELAGYWSLDGKLWLTHFTANTNITDIDEMGVAVWSTVSTGPSVGVAAAMVTKWDDGTYTGEALKFLKG